MNNPKFQTSNLPKLELMKTNTPYAITLNSREAFPFLNPWQEHYFHLIDKHLCKHGYQFNLYPELSPTGRLHYHGTIIFTTYAQILKLYTSDLAFVTKCSDLNVKIKPIENDESWSIYMMKQQPILTSMMVSKSVPKRDKIQLNITSTSMKKWKRDLTKLSPIVQFSTGCDDISSDEELLDI